MYITDFLSRPVLKHILPVCLILWSACVYAASGKTYQVHYTFTKKSKDTISVTVRFMNFAKDIHSVLLPSEWAGQKNLYQAIHNIKVEEGTARLIQTNRPDSLEVIHNDKKAFTITYDLCQDFSVPLAYPLYFRPVIQENIFFITGYSGLLYPKLENHSKVNCTVTYTGFPTTALTGNSFFYNSTRQQFSTDIEELRNAFYFAGDMRFKEIITPGSKLVIALSGNYAFTDEELFSNISRVVYEERRFWKDTVHPYFIVTLLPIESASTGGTAYHNSFSVFYNPKFKLNQGLQYLIAHEYFHTWIGQKMQQMEPEESGKWFAEGFTDYYTYQMLLKTNLLTEEAYLAKINDVLRRYYLSPQATYKNEAIVGNYFGNQAVQQLVYNRGMIIAMLLNGKIVENKNGSLDVFLLDYYAHAGNPKIFNEEKFFSILKKYVGEDGIQMVKDINEGKNDLLLTNLLMPGYQAEKKEITAFELGFDLTASKKNGMITGLIAGSAAEKAGLKEKQAMSGAFSIYNGDTERTAKITIVENGEKRVVEYLPVRKSGITGISFRK